MVEVGGVVQTCKDSFRIAPPRSRCKYHWSLANRIFWHIGDILLTCILGWLLSCESKYL